MPMKGGGGRSANQRYKARGMTLRLALHGHDFMWHPPEFQFNHRLAFLKNILASWESGVDITVECLNIQDTTFGRGARHIKKSVNLHGEIIYQSS